MRPFFLIAALIGLWAATACGDGSPTGQSDLPDGQFIDTMEPGPGPSVYWNLIGDGSLHAHVDAAEAVAVVAVTDVVSVDYYHSPMPPGIELPKEGFPQEGIPATTYSASVEQWLKGGGPDQVLISQGGGPSERTGKPIVFDGTFLLQPGRRYLLLLGGITKGEYQPLYGGRGAFEVTDGFVHVLNHPNAGAFQEQYSGMPLDGFVALVNTYVATPYTGPTPPQGPAPSPEPASGYEGRFERPVSPWCDRMEPVEEFPFAPEQLAAA